MSGLDKVRSTARTPTYSGTTTGEWSRPDLEDYGYESVEDIPDDASPHPAEHSLLGEKDGETWDEVSVLPVVDSNGNLNKSGLESAKTYASQVEGISQDTVENAKEKANQLLRDEFEVEKASGVDKRELVTLVANAYDVTTGEALEMLNTMEEVEQEMQKEEIVETIKKIEDGEIEISDALDKFVDVDIETIKEIKEELEQEEEEVEEEGEETEKEETEKSINDKIDDKIEKKMEEEDMPEHKAMVQVMEENPDLYKQYTYEREVG